MTNNIKWCSTSTVIRKMKINAKIRCHYTSIRMAKGKNTDNTKCCPRCRENENCCWGINNANFEELSLFTKFEHISMTKEF